MKEYKVNPSINEEDYEDFSNHILIILDKFPKDTVKFKRYFPFPEITNKKSKI